MAYQQNDMLNQLITAISECPLDFATTSAVYKHWADTLPAVIEKMYQHNRQGKFELMLFGQIELPYVSFGNINSTHLFGLDEIILFVFYWNNRKRYRLVYDLGANIGLHTIMMSRCGFTVHSFEPDPHHIDILSSNVDKNHCELAKVHASAVSVDDTEKSFIRVKGNTTGSHLAGMKKDPYGELDTFTVNCTSFKSILDQRPSLIKMDIEGAEAQVICTTEQQDWSDTDMLLEVGSSDNATAIWRHLHDIGVNSFSQKCGWQQVQSQQDIPSSYKEGSLFISAKEAMPW